MTCREARRTLEDYKTLRPKEFVSSVETVHFAKKLAKCYEFGIRYKVEHQLMEEMMRRDRADLLMAFPLHSVHWKGQVVCLCDVAASYDSLNCMIQIQQQHKCDCSDHLCVTASRHGALKCLEHLLANGCFRNNDEITYEAIQNNQLACLRSALKNGCPLSHRACDELKLFAPDEEEGYNECETYLLTNYPERTTWY
eukprot:gene32283-40878_t